jgi:hypothetical protein
MQTPIDYTFDDPTVLELSTAGKAVVDTTGRLCNGTPASPTNG